MIHSYLTRNFRVKTSYLLPALLFSDWTFGSGPFSNTCFLSCFSPPMSDLELSVILVAGVAIVVLKGRVIKTVLDALLVRKALALLAVLK